MLLNKFFSYVCQLVKEYVILIHKKDGGLSNKDNLDALNRCIQWVNGGISELGIMISYCEQGGLLRIERIDEEALNEK